MKPFERFKNQIVTLAHLQERERRIELAGYKKSKWIGLCEELIYLGFEVRLYEAKKSNSKYITVTHTKSPGKSYKIRVSNHKPILEKELAGTCDFFVGHTNLVITTCRQALTACFVYFGNYHEA